MLLGIAFVSAVIGFAWLALAMDVHWRQVHAGEPAAGRWRAPRAAGIAALLASASLAVAADTPAIGALVWLMMLAVAGPLVAFALAWRPALLRPLWPAGRGARHPRR